LARTIKKENIDRILNHPSILKGIVIMAIPVFLNNLFKSLHDMVDAIFVARIPFESSESMDAALAALNIHWPIFNFFLALGAGLGIATVSIVSQYIGAKRKDLAVSYASKLMVLSVIVGLLVTLVFILTSDWIWGYNLLAYMMGAKGETLFFASNYFRIRSFEMVFVFMFIVYQAVRQATGETLFPVILNVGSIFVNIILTWLFISKFNMGINGAAYATLIAQGSLVPFMLYDLFHSKKHIKIEVKEMKLDMDTIKDMSRFALPASLGQAVSSLGFVVIQSVILRYGKEVSAGFSVGNRISSLLLNPVVAISTILAAYVGLNIGNNQPKRAKDSYKVARNLGLGLMVIGVSIIIPLRFGIIEFILGTKDTNSYEIAAEYTFWLLLTQPFMSLFQSYIGLFNGSGHSNYTLKLASLRLWGMRIPMIFLFMAIFDKSDYSGIWYAMIISNFLILFYGHSLKKSINYEVQVRL
jgi:putative MATE family efflux protein